MSRDNFTQEYPGLCALRLTTCFSIQNMPECGNRPPVNRQLTRFQWLSLVKRPPFWYDGTKEKEGYFHGIEGPYRCRPQSGGLTQEQLGELLGHPAGRQQVGERPDHAGRRHHRRAVRKAPCVGGLCAVGKGAGEGQTAAYEPPDTCPCCGRKVSGSICPECGYQLPNHPPRGPQYAVVATRPGFVQSTELSAQLVKYCGFTQEDANNAIAHYVNNQSRILLRRGLVDSAAQYIAAHLDQDFFCPQIVVDCGGIEEALLYKPKAFETPSPVKSQEGIGFWGVVGAVIVALLILSFF